MRDRTSFDSTVRVSLSRISRLPRCISPSAVSIVSWASAANAVSAFLSSAFKASVEGLAVTFCVTVSRPSDLPTIRLLAALAVALSES